MLTSLLMLFAIGVVAVVVVGVVLAIVGTVFSVVFGLGGFLLFKVAPLLLIGWVVLKLINRGSCRRHIASSDEKWLDT
ncbi:MAG TPA: hypothetical protein VFL93_16005 [Longimicrobiaceae bacterium]|nr:hypothetical protein [Longimicrobiaceae bacterium]